MTTLLLKGNVTRHVVFTLDVEKDPLDRTRWTAMVADASVRPTVSLSALGTIDVAPSPVDLATHPTLRATGVTRDAALAALAKMVNEL